MPLSKEGSRALVQPDTWGSGPPLSAIGVQWSPCPGSLWYRPWSSGGHGSAGCWTLGLGAAGVFTPRISTTVVWPQSASVPHSPQTLQSSTPSSCLCRAPGLARVASICALGSFTCCCRDPSRASACVHVCACARLCRLLCVLCACCAHGSASARVCVSAWGCVRLWMGQGVCPGA